MATVRRHVCEARAAAAVQLARRRRGTAQWAGDDPSPMIHSASITWLDSLSEPDGPTAPGTLPRRAAGHWQASSRGRTSRGPILWQLEGPVERGGARGSERARHWPHGGRRTAGGAPTDPALTSRSDIRRRPGPPGPPPPHPPQSRSLPDPRRTDSDAGTASPFRRDSIRVLRPDPSPVEPAPPASGLPSPGGAVTGETKSTLWRYVPPFRQARVAQHPPPPATGGSSTQMAGAVVARAEGARRRPTRRAGACACARSADSTVLRPVAWLLQTTAGQARDIPPGPPPCQEPADAGTTRPEPARAGRRVRRPADWRVWQS